MTEYKVDELIKEVRITLDENSVQNEYLESSTDNMELDEIIREKLIDAIRFIIESAPIKMLSADALTLVSDEDIIAEEDGSGYFKLPDDFLRFVSFKLSSWCRAVNDVAEEGSDIDKLQRNKLSRGTPLKPVCVYSHDSEGNRTIEYFTAGKDSAGVYNHEVEKALYIAYPVVETGADDDKVRFSSLLKFAIINYCAGLTEVSRGNSTQADVFFKIATSAVTQ